jgi:ADP-ribose pyrophosphatase YjhB (NUDIX family)
VTLNRIGAWLLQRYWRMTRGLRLRAEGCIIDAEQRVLLLQKTTGDASGWQLPGGLVEDGEAGEQALSRILRAQTGIVPQSPELFWIYANTGPAPGDHIALYAVRDWQETNAEPADLPNTRRAFFRVTEMPDSVDAATLDRIIQILDGRAPDKV